MKKTNIGKVALSATVLFFLMMSSSSVFAQQEKTHTDRFIYRPKPLKSMNQALQTISRVLNDKCVRVDSIARTDGKTSYLNKIKYKKAIVTDQGIELKLRSGTIMIDFSKLFGEKDIVVRRSYYLVTDAKTGQKYRDSYSDLIDGTKKFDFMKFKAGFGVTMPYPSYYPTCNLQLADALFTVQRKLNKSGHNSELETFKLLAEKYRAMKVKPTMPEEQRKYVVQANYYNGKKNYQEAIKLYKKAIDIDSTAYPGAYYNLALLFAQENSYEAAIFYMKEYLLLEPDAKDARAAQDKIYVWEAKVNPPD